MELLERHSGQTPGCQGCDWFHYILRAMRIGAALYGAGTAIYMDVTTPAVAATQFMGRLGRELSPR